MEVIKLLGSKVLLELMPIEEIKTKLILSNEDKKKIYGDKPIKAKVLKVSDSVKSIKSKDIVLINQYHAGITIDKNKIVIRVAEIIAIVK